MVRLKELSEAFRKTIVAASGKAFKKKNSLQVKDIQNNWQHVQVWNLIPTVKHAGEMFLVWGCFAAVGPGQLMIIEANMNSTVFQRVLEEHLIACKTIKAEADLEPAIWQWPKTYQWIHQGLAENEEMKDLEITTSQI